MLPREISSKLHLSVKNFCLDRCIGYKLHSDWLNRHSLHHYLSRYDAATFNSTASGPKIMLSFKFLRYLLSYRVNVQPYRPPEILQCFLCQRLGHSQKTCFVTLFASNVEMLTLLMNAQRNLTLLRFAQTVVETTQQIIEDVRSSKMP